MSGQVYRVRTACVTVKVPGDTITTVNPTGKTIMTLYQGARLPAGVDQADIERLLEGGFLEAVPA